MSLKAFHIAFISISTLLAVGFGIWGAWSYAQSGNLSHLLMGIGSFITAILLAWYFKWFLRKLKNIGYL
jgi:hypothetical protein